MGIVVKASAYLDKHGEPTMHRARAYHHHDIELAKAAAQIANGEVIELIKVEKTQQQEIMDKSTKPKTKKSNQSWMRGLK